MIQLLERENQTIRKGLANIIPSYSMMKKSLLWMTMISLIFSHKYIDILTENTH